MRRSGEIVHVSARSPTSLVPVRSVGSTRISVLYCGAPGCSIAKVSSWWASKVGGSAATTKSSSPPRRGVSWAAAGVTSSETRASAVRNVFMVGIILAPMKTIVALPGEGIGVEVVEATCALLSGAGVPVKIVTPPQISAPGSPVPEDTQRACREADAVLFGAAGPATTRVVGWLRWEMDAWAGVRPAKFYPGMRSPLADPDGIDLVVIRENSEGMYPGREGDIAELARALPTVRDRFGRGLDRYKDGRFAVKVVTRAGAARIARFACELARRRKARGHAGKVTCVTKSNVLPQTDGLFHAIVKETVATYPDLAFEHFHVDDAARRIIRFPKTMDVVVCMNQYADILSDVAGEVAGGLGGGRRAGGAPVRRPLRLPSSPPRAEPAHSSRGSSRRNRPERSSASVCSISARVFMTNGPYRAIGSCSGRAAASKKRPPSSPASASTRSPSPKTTRAGARTTLRSGPNRTAPAST